MKRNLMELADSLFQKKKKIEKRKKKIFYLFMQESKYKRINTKSLFGEFKSGLENLELTEEGFRLTRRGLYKPGNDILNEPDMLKYIFESQFELLTIGMSQGHLPNTKHRYIPATKVRVPVKEFTDFR